MTRSGGVGEQPRSSRPLQGSVVTSPVMPHAFLLDGRTVSVAGPAYTTLLDWLRSHGHTGTKEGCAEGDCGACTVVIADPVARSFRIANSCILLLPQVVGAEVWTVDGIGSPDAPHPAQQVMVDGLGSQCGFCTPGFVMALFEATYREDLKDPWQLDDQLAGNLCRCTGYRPIQDALNRVAGTRPADRFRARLEAPSTPLPAVAWDDAGTRFDAPTSLGELFQLRSMFPGARLVAGATDLGLDVTQHHARPSHLIDLGRVPDLSEIRNEGGVIHLGSTARLADIEAATAVSLPALHRMLRYFGGRAIKQQGTLGGNLCTASPIGDTAPVLLAHAAVAVIGSLRGERRVPLASFFTGYRVIDLAQDEILLRVEVPLPGPGVRTGAYKVSRRRELDISAVSLGAWVRVEAGRVAEIRLAYGGVAATPARATLCESRLVGRPWTPLEAEAASSALAADFKPLSDLRGSAEFRQTLVRNLLVGFAIETQHHDFVPLPTRHSGTVVLEGA